jgi:DNA-binding transcriptional LysR family regulator
VSAFIAVVEQGGFRGAARQLGISKSALSERVAELERHLGVQLLARTTRNVKLTEIGASYHRLVVPALRTLGDAERMVRQMTVHPSGRLRLTAPNELGQLLFGEVLASYATRYPDVVLEVELSDRRVNLVDEGFDLALRIGPMPDSGLVTRKLGDALHMGVYASPEFLSLHGTPAEPRELTRLRCMVMSSSTTPTQWSFVRKGKREIIPITPVVSINSYQVLGELAAAGLGIARLPYVHARGHLERGGLIEILRSYAAPPLAPFALYPSGRLSPAVRAMIDLWLEHFGRKALGQRAAIA